MPVSRERYLASMEAVPGWFGAPDPMLFEAIDTIQGESGFTGNLLEIGVYHGRSAVLLGYLLRTGERLVLCDLFGQTGSTAENREEMAYQYARFTPPPTAEQFLARWHVYHADAPELVGGTSSAIAETDNTFRLVHVDGGHVFDVVQGDLATARRLLTPGGIVVLDDFRNQHTPGVAAAGWAAVAMEGLSPLCLTPAKMYATWHPDLCPVTAREFQQVVRTAPQFETVRDTIRGMDVAVVLEAGYFGYPSKASKASKLRDLVPPAAARAAGRIKSRLQTRQ